MKTYAQIDADKVGKIDKAYINVNIEALHMRQPIKVFERSDILHVFEDNKVNTEDDKICFFIIYKKIEIFFNCNIY